MYTPDGRNVGRYAAYEDALGVKTVAWSPTGKLLAIGSYDQKVRGIRLQSGVQASACETVHTGARREWC